ncbi:MAG TPA: N-methyl-L-tryptophan oxidase [Candidatus Acidoferrum sp.]|nr:N-methyl-L-tryptophan oxidase [Candidatus Acidoferrum sp.]
MTRDADVIVLGLGGIGSGAAYWSTKLGARVEAFERFEFGHARGESHDHSRIIRLSYVTPAYVRFAKDAYAAWTQLERDSGETIVYRTGGLDLGPKDGAIPLEGYADAMRSEGVSFEHLDADAIRTRWPQFRIDDGVRGLFQADGGIVAAERATRAHQRMAVEGGARLHERTSVDAIDCTGGEVAVRAGGQTYRAGRLIVAAGPWSAPVLDGLGYRVPLEVTKEQAMYFAVERPDAFAMERFPIWIWMDDPSFYGFPVFGEFGAVKITQDAGGRPVDPDVRTFEEDPELSMRVAGFVHELLPTVGPVRIVKTCLYTLTPDRDFVIDRLPHHPQVSIAIGAGHAFKFASAIGRVLALDATSGALPDGLSDFSILRPVLQMADPPKSYMV